MRTRTFLVELPKRSEFSPRVTIAPNRLEFSWDSYEIWNGSRQRREHCAGPGLIVGIRRAELSKFPSDQSRWIVMELRTDPDSEARQGL